MLMKKRHFTKEEIARALRQEETETAKNFHKNSRRAQGKSAKKGARLPAGPHVAFVWRNTTQAAVGV